ncbi:MAG: glycosyltransferase family 39 protein [Planctomycetota bacterium]
MSQPPPPPEARLRLAMGVVLLVHAACMVALCWQEKLTPDEANYVLAGCIVRHDLRFDAYNTVLHGPLAFWPNQLGVLFADPSDVAAYAPWGRLGFVPFPVLAALGLRTLAQRAFGPAVALAALLAWATNPLVLAHGCLMTADMALTCGSLWTMERTWRWLQAPSLPRLLAVGALLGATLATKYLGLLLVPALALILAVALARGFVPRLLLSRSRSSFVARLADGALAGLLVAGSAWAALFTCYLWLPHTYRVREAPAGVAVAPEDPSYGPKSAALRAVAASRLGRAALEALPEPFVRGVDYQKLVSEGLPTSFGDRVAPGFWSYYVVAFATKLPLAFLVLLILGSGVRTPAWPHWLATVGIAAVGVPLLFLSGITRLQIGVRYALTAVPWLCLVAGRGWTWLWQSGPRLRLIAGALAGVLVVGTFHAWPAFLTDFNRLAPRPYLWFSDSTLDWRVAGADDPELRIVRQRHPQALVVDGARGPTLGLLVVHGDQLATRDPRDPTRIHHWLRRFWPSDRQGAWFVFDVDEAAFHAAVATAPDRARARTEFAAALVAAGHSDAVAELLRDNPDADAASVSQAATDLRSGDPSRAAAAALQLGRPDLVASLGDGVPRSLRAQALLALHDAEAVVALLESAPTGRQPPEVYLLATALAEAGRPEEALARLEQVSPDPAAEPTHRRIVERLRQLIEATRHADQRQLRR